MAVVGIRCSNKDYTYAIVRGTRESPELVDRGGANVPKGFTKSQALKWMYQESEGLLDKHDVRKMVVKKFEGRTRGNTFEDRVEFESAIMVAAANKGINAIFKKMKSTIAKNLGQKGHSKYLARLDTSWISEFDALPEKSCEAIVAAWSELE